MIEQKVLDRFWEKVDKSGECWEWTAGKTTQGYGAIQYKGKTFYAHRLSWMIENGEIPEGMLICHHCDNPGCVNPPHLFMGSCKDNSQDAVKKGRWADRKGESHGRAKHTEEQVLSIRGKYKTGKITQRELARKHKVSPATINYIVTRKTWKHI